MYRTSWLGTSHVAVDHGRSRPLAKGGHHLMSRSRYNRDLSRGPSSVMPGAVVTFRSEAVVPRLGIFFPMIVDGGLHGRDPRRPSGDG